MFCSYIQWSVSRALDHGQRLSVRAERHIAKCARCKRFYDAALKLDRQLRDVDDTRGLVDPALPERIMLNLGRDADKGDSIILPIASPIRVGMRIAALVVIVLTIGLIWQQSQVPEAAPVQPTAEITQTNTALQDLMSVPGMLTELDVSDGQQNRTSIMTNPLETEIKSLTEEAEQMADFLFVSLMIDS
ncbi:MAG: hypothetical protein JW936_11820 [Sedimentisphaerales bacterium]|nr:hypothetical protein [Sedimentisphaerales bacterium]